MIHVQELRIGNLIIWNPKLLHPEVTLLPIRVEVAALFSDKIGYTPFELEQRVEPFEDDRMVQMETHYKTPHEFEPVALSQEILHMAGFDKKNSSYSHKNFYPKLVFKADSWYTELSPNYPPIACRYLHQLQNVYFVVTGEELKING